MVLTAIQWFPPDWRICIKLKSLTKDWILQAPYVLEIRIKLDKLLYHMNMGIVEPLSSKKVIFVFLRQLFVPNLDPVIPIITCNNDYYYTVLSLTDIDNNHFEAYLLDHLHHHLWSPCACAGICQTWDHQSSWRDAAFWMCPRFCLQWRVDWRQLSSCAERGCVF